MKFSLIVLLCFCLISTCLIHEATAQSDHKTVNFKLENKTAFSIPLVIPDVMNPNLSPFSKSSVGLKIGQEIFFKGKKKKYLLLTVDEAIRDDDVLDVAKLIKQRKKALGL